MTQYFFEAYPLHNLLHDKILSIYSRVLRKPDTELANQLMHSSLLLDALTQGLAKVDASLVCKPKHPPYLSHYIAIGDLLYAHHKTDGQSEQASRRR